MNTPNPLVPQGSLQEQSKRKSQVRIIIFSILAIHVVLLGALLIQGCRREEPIKTDLPPLPPLPTNAVEALPPGNALVPPLPTNVIVPPPPPPPPLTNIVDVPPAAPSEHIVQKGDTFGKLAQQYGVSVKAIQQANPGVDSSKLKINQKLVIPPKPPGGVAAPAGAAKSGEAEAGGEALYAVKQGDNLTKIAAAHGVTVKALRAANNLRTDQLKVAQKLKIPAKGAAPAPAAAPAVPAPAPLAPPPLPPMTSPPAAPLAPSSP